MLAINRRCFLSSVSLFVVGCSTNGAANSGLVKAVQVGQTVVTAFIQEVPTFFQLFPDLVPAGDPEKIYNGKDGWLDIAKADLDGLQTMITSNITDTSAAGILDTVEKYINMAVKDFAPIMTVITDSDPRIAEAVMIYRDIVLALPLLEAFINSVIPPALGATTASRLPAATRAKAALAGNPKGANSETAYAHLKMRVNRK